ncbi:beta-ketoacyl synthase N-terminal-like domain-containing protein [Aquihabitans daechungensis]|uniref:beta-ketoacyl synthase N-terminal-like domain-containing protein n=1 Tax=Aquihabitans daechungensis TaxID=1052257 RepID=UPI003B9E774C
MSGSGGDGIAIVGIAGLFPGAPTIADFWANIRSGVDATTEVPEGRWDPVFFDADAKEADRFYCRRGGFVDDLATFDPLAFGIMPNAVDSVEPDQLLALAAASAALADAGNPHERTDPSKISVVLGRGGYIGDGVARLDQRVRTAQQLVEALRVLVPDLDEARLAQVKAEFQDRLGPERPESSIGLVPNLAASRIANRFDLRGAAYTVDAACASSLIAVDHAANQLRSGAVDVVLAGGVHHCHDLTLWSVFCQLRALSPTEVIRPFSRDADGILVGEGTGIFVLKRVADAERDGDRIYAVIRGTGVASDGAGASLMNPRPEGQILAVEQAWAASGLDPATVGLIEAHGTATPVGDRTELETLRAVFGPDDGSSRRAGLGSVKSMIGHAMPAAGAAGLAKAALAIFHGELPPTLHVDEPNEALADTRFRLIAETEPWETPGDQPRTAGVNAFGFGGINAHVVLTEHPGSLSATRTPPFRGRSRAETGDSGSAVSTDTRTPPFRGRSRARTLATEEVLLLAGRDAADLLAQLDGWTPGEAVLAVPGPGDGAARLAIVEPNERRLTLARKVLERGTPFRGRNDVWFEPGGETGIRGGKVAFLFPGVEPVFEPRVDDVADQLDLAWDGLAEDVPPLERQGRGIVQVGLLLDEALAAIGVRPDLAAGHSLGEWTGQIVSGQIPTSYVDEFLDGLQPGSIEVSDVVFVALGAGVEVAEALVAGLDDAYVSHDNCPHQSVICAPAASMAIAIERAKERKMLAQELPFRSGFHSPLFAPFVASMGEQFAGIPLAVPSVPMWSATTVEPYPDDAAGITELSGRHLVEPVRFRELAEALYADGVRTFVQVGTGSLLGFIDDTLRDQDILTITANTPKQTGIGQLRRVAAALWSVGHPVDFAPLGHRTTPSGAPHGAGSEPELPPAKAAGGGGQRLVLGSSLIRDLTPLDRPVADRPDDADWADLDAPGALLDEFRGGLADASAAALDVLRAARDSKRSLSVPVLGSVPGAPSAEAPEPEPSPTTLESGGAPEGEATAAAEAPSPSLKETVHHLSVADQPYWLDHAFYEQPAGWPVVDDLFPLVPMTAIIEMLQHAAEDLVPGSVATRVEAIRAFKWLTVHPPTAVTVRAARDGDGANGETGETAVKASIDKHARATVVVAPAYPEPPAPRAVPVHGRIHCPCTPETLYDERHLFHGPAYQGLLTFDEFGDDGASGLLETKDFPGSLLDNAGQLFGFWLAQRVDKDRLVLPTSIDRISFYGPHPAAGTVVRCVVNATEIGEVVVRADLELTIDGVVWCRIEGWEDRRFQSDDRLFTLLRKPHDRTLAEPQPGGWVLVREGWPDSASRDVVMRRFLGIDERADYDTRNPNVQRTWLLGRIAAKDAVRDLLWRSGTEGRIFPVEVTVGNDPEGAPHVTAPDGSDVRVSIAHTAGLGVAIAAHGTAVGIDIERIEDRPDSFELAALSKKERARFEELPDIDRQSTRDLELTRWWAAKEAAAKAAGTGMQGRPKDWKIVEVDGDRLRIGARWFATARVGTEHVVAWTEVDPAPPTTPALADETDQTDQTDQTERTEG